MVVRGGRPLDFSPLFAVLGCLLMAACSGPGGASNSSSQPISSLSAADGAFVNRTLGQRVAASGWKQFKATPVNEITDPTTNRGIVVLFRYSAVTPDGVARGFVSVRGDNDEDRGTLSLGSIQNPPNGPAPDAVYQLSPAWRDKLETIATDFVGKQQLRNEQASFLVAIGAGNQDNPTALASYRIQGQTDNGQREYFVTVLVDQQQGTIAAATSVPIGPQVTPTN